MEKAGSVTYWFCVGVAVFLILWGVWDTLFGPRGPGGILLFCLMVAATFYLAGSWVRRMARKAAKDA
jgi:hypothetical protein